jgi:hypothetical protein
MLSQTIRIKPDSSTPLRKSIVAGQAIATSTGQNDSGTFETILRDDRFLWFEGLGAISDWRVTLPLETNTFGRDTLADVVLHLRYTARDGGEPFANARRKELGLPPFNSSPPPDPIPINEALLVSSAHDLPDAWTMFLNQPDDGTPQTLSLSLTADMFPPIPSGKTKINVASVRVMLRLADGISYDTIALTVGQKGGTTSAATSLKSDPAVLNGTPRAEITVKGTVDPTKPWNVTLTTIPSTLGASNGTTRLDPAKVVDFVFLFFFQFA